jgi:hypothetical protein
MHMGGCSLGGQHSPTSPRDQKTGKCSKGPSTNPLASAIRGYSPEGRAGRAVVQDLAQEHEEKKTFVALNITGCKNAPKIYIPVDVFQMDVTSAIR